MATGQLDFDEQLRDKIEELRPKLEADEARTYENRDADYEAWKRASNALDALDKAEAIVNSDNPTEDDLERANTLINNTDTY